MKTIAIKGDERTALGKAANKALRKEGKVPCVVYGPNVESSMHFSVYQADFKNLVYTPNTYLVLLEVGGSKMICKLQDMQFHPVSEEIVHADFYQIDPAQETVLNVPVRVIGNSVGVREGGKLMKKMSKLRCKGLIQKMPEFVEVDVSDLVIGKSIRVRDVQIPELEILDTPENTIVSVIVTRAAMSAAGAAGEAEEGEAGEDSEGEAAAE
jgi:large subunit ribosomal protein L25